MVIIGLITMDIVRMPIVMVVVGIINKKGPRIQVKSKQNIQRKEPRFCWQGI